MRYQRTKGFTLIELMIAVALMVILTGSVVFVFTQAQEIYTRTDALVRVNQNARQALGILERDISNAYKTIDMEFWGPDQPNGGVYNGHLDQNEKYYPGGGYNFTAPTGPGGASQEEDDYRLVKNGEVPYFFSMAFKSGKYTESGPAAREHYSDSMYFKTETPIENSGKASSTRTAMVRYGLSLDSQNPPRRPPILMKWITWNDKSSSAVKPVAVAPQALCYQVTDFRIEVYIKNKRHNLPGQFYSIEEALALGGNFGSPLKSKEIFTPLFINSSKGPGTSYDGGSTGEFWRSSTGEPYFTVTPQGQGYDNAPQKGQEAWFLYQLGKGDKLFLYNPETVGTNNTAIPAGEYTIKDIRFDSGKWKVYFREAIDTSQMDKANLTKTSISYRGGWVPSAVRITLKVVDSQSVGGPKEISQTIVRVFKILGS